jgi:cobalt/nickel transport system permease protein
MGSHLSIDQSVREFRRLDLLAEGDTAVHRLDARAKVVVAIAFIVTVVSVDRYAVALLLPFLAYPAAMIAAARLPTALVLRRAALVLPFALMVGILNPLFDRTVLLHLGPLAVAGGWLSCASIVLRALLAAAAAVVLVGTTGFPAICGALERFGMPRPFVVQLMFLYRYLALLGEETGRLARARELRAFGHPIGLGEFGSLAGNLLVRTWQRAERIYMAMLARGFDGTFPARAGTRFGVRELIFVAGWLAAFAALRFGDVTVRLGHLVLGPSS